MDIGFTISEACTIPLKLSVVFFLYGGLSKEWYPKALNSRAQERTPLNENIFLQITLYSIILLKLPSEVFLISEFNIPFSMKNKQDKQLNFDLSEPLFSTSHVFNFTIHYILFLLLILNFENQIFKCGILLPTMTICKCSNSKYSRTSVAHWWLIYQSCFKPVPTFLSP